MSLQEVENAISAMNQAAFQKLGDLFMISQNRDYRAFVCTGSQYTHKQTKSRNISAFNFSNKIFCDIYSLPISFMCNCLNCVLIYVPFSSFRSDKSWVSVSGCFILNGVYV